MTYLQCIFYIYHAYSTNFSLLFSRRLLQIDQETKRTMAIPHLNNKEKQCIMREKYMATMRPVSACVLVIHY